MSDMGDDRCQRCGWNDGAHSSLCQVTPKRSDDRCIQCKRYTNDVSGICLECRTKEGHGLTRSRVAPISLTGWMLASFNVATEKGWHEKPNHPAVSIANMHRELSELLEAYTRDPKAPCDKPIALTRAEEEVADVFLRLVDFCQEEHLDLEKAVRLKHGYNQTREYRHGGKKF